VTGLGVGDDEVFVGDGEDVGAIGAVGFGEVGGLNSDLAALLLHPLPRGRVGGLAILRDDDYLGIFGEDFVVDTRLGAELIHRVSLQVGDGDLVVGVEAADGGLDVEEVEAGGSGLVVAVHLFDEGLEHVEVKVLEDVGAFADGVGLGLVLEVGLAVFPDGVLVKAAEEEVVEDATGPVDKVLVDGEAIVGGEEEELARGVEAVENGEDFVLVFFGPCLLELIEKDGAGLGDVLKDEGDQVGGEGLVEDKAGHVLLDADGGDELGEEGFAGALLAEEEAAGGLAAKLEGVEDAGSEAGDVAVEAGGKGEGRSFDEEGAFLGQVDGVVAGWEGFGEIGVGTWLNTPVAIGISEDGFRFCHELTPCE